MYPLKCKIGGVQSPFSVELHSLCVGKFICKARSSWTRCQKRRWLKSHHWSREKAQGASVHLETLKNIGGVEEPHHGHPTQI